MPPEAPFKPAQRFTDADFFRRVVADRAESMQRYESEAGLVDIRWEIGKTIRDQFPLYRTAYKSAADFHNAQTEMLITVAAMIERAAVDITIPQYRAAIPSPAPKKGRGVCRKCGCTDDNACPQGCSWANASHTLCTACAPKKGRARRSARAASKPTASASKKGKAK